MQLPVRLALASLALLAPPVHAQVVGTTRIDGGPYGPGFGSTVAAAGDVDGDGVQDLLVAAQEVGRIWLLFLDADGQVRSARTIYDSGFREDFGLTGLGDLDLDGTPDVAVGSETQRFMLVIFLRPDGSVRRTIEHEAFGRGYGGSLEVLPDLNGDGIQDLLVAAPREFDDLTGLVHVHYLLRNGFRVPGFQTLSLSLNRVCGPLSLVALPDQVAPGRVRFVSNWRCDASFHEYEPGVTFGWLGRLEGVPRRIRGLAYDGDLDDDGRGDLLAALREDDGSHTLHVMLLEPGPTPVVRSTLIVRNGEGGLGDVLEPTDRFGQSMAPLGDLDGDGNREWAIGAPGATDSGAVWILSFQPLVAGLVSSRPGDNPELLTSAERPLLGSTWSAQVDLGQADASVAFLGLGGSLDLSVPIGTLLCAAPYLVLPPSTTGMHELAVPASPGLLGAEVCVQALTLAPGRNALTNALDLRLGDI